MKRFIGLLLLAMALPAADCFALDVLVNQVGYDPRSPKVFRVQLTSDYAGEGTFSVRRVSDGATVHSGKLARKGGLWDRWYWEGDFSALNTPGEYSVSATVGAETGTSYNFSIAEDVYLDETGKLAYEYFYTQRCGVAVPGWHGVCHADDGIRKDNGQHIDAVGGWHDAGDYNKFPHGFASDGLFGLLWLYDTYRSYYDPIDTDANGVPDIIDEALHQARWLVKMVEPNGHVMRETQKRRIGSSWVRPESDTNNRIGDYDDRWINPGDELTPQEITVCAALIKMHRILASKGLPTESFRDKALAIWNHRAALAVAEGGHNNLGNSAMQIFAGLDLYAETGQQDCWDRAVQRVAELAETTTNNPRCYDSIEYAEGPGYELGVLAWFARTYPQVSCSPAARTACRALMTRYMELANDPVGLIRRDESGTLQYFPTNPEWNGFYLGINRLYLLLTWGAGQAYRTIGDPAYLRFAMDQYNWVMGANYNNVCMVVGAGKFNLPRYHTRYDKIPGHESGAQPGLVPNGYVRYYASGLPYIDLSTNRYQTNEGWLINNAAYAMALAEMTVFRDNTPPAQATGFTAVAGVGRNTLTWTNPSDDDFAGTMIRWSTVKYPASPAEGALLVDRPNMPGSSDSFVHTGLTAGQTCYYSAFTYDQIPNHSAPANASAAPAGEVCFFEDFSCPGGLLPDCNGWTGMNWSKFSLVDQALRIGGGRGAAEISRRIDCPDGGTGVIGVGLKFKKGVGTYTLWDLWINDPLGNNLARWYGSGSTIRGRIGNYSQVTPSKSLTGGWDDAYVKIFTATNQTQFFLNGVPIGTLNHAPTGAGDVVGEIRIVSLDNASTQSDFVLLDSISVGLAPDGSLPGARLLTDGSLISLGNKALYLKQDGFGYIEEPDRSTGIRVHGSIPADEGDLVYLTGTVRTSPGGERYIELSLLSPGERGGVKPMGASNRALRSRTADGLYVKAWGKVKAGSVTANSFVLTDGSDDTGIRVITADAPGVTPGDFVTVEGAAGYDGERVIYRK